MATTPVQNLFPTVTGLGNGNMVNSAVSTPQLPMSLPSPVFGPTAPILAAPIYGPPAPPIVSTSSLANQDVTNKMAVMTTAGPAPKPVVVTPSGQQDPVATAKLQKEADNMAKYGNAFGPGFDASGKPLPPGSPAAGTLPAGATTTSTATPAPTGATPEQTSASAAQAAADAATAIEQGKQDAADAQIISDLDAARNGTLALSPDQQNQVDAMTAQYKQLMDQQRVANKNYEAAIGQAGIAAGRNMYAPEVEQGNIAAAVSAGVASLATINSEMIAAISKAKEAFSSNNIDLLSKSYDVYSKGVERRQKVIDDTYKKVTDSIKAQQDAIKQKMDLALTSAQIAEIQNKPIRDLKADALDFVQSMVLAHPDAGITADDTFTTMSEKVTNSQSFKNEQAKKVADAQGSASAPLVRTGTPDANGFVTQEYSNDGGQTWHTGVSDVSQQFSATHPVGTDVLSQAANNSIIRATVGKDDNGVKKRVLQDSWAKGSPKEFVGVVKSTVKDGMESTSLQLLESNEKAVEILPLMKADINAYVAGGGSMNIFSSTGNYATQEIGKIQDPELKKLAVSIQAYVQKYRKDITGAAYSATEAKEYEGLFPTAKDSKELADAKLDGLLLDKQREVDASYGAKLGSDNWTQLKEMSKYENTISRDDYNALVASGGTDGQAKADAALKQTKTWIVDLPKADGGAGATKIVSMSIGTGTVKVDNSIASKLASADSDFFHATGQHLAITESFRTREQQQILYDKLSKTGGRVAKPGTSFHERGLAVDVSNWQAAEPYLRKYGLVNDLADDKNHFSFGETNPTATA